MTTIDCPSCGIGVQAGYPRCPKCHAEMPGAARNTLDPSADRVSGGTSVGGDGPPWLWISVGAVALAGVLGFVLLSGGSGDDDADDGAGDQPVATAPAVRETDRPVPAPAPAVPDPIANEVPQALAIDAVLEQFRAKLDESRLWASVEIASDDITLSVTSGYCADPNMRGAISSLTAELKTAGIQQVTCYERHGAVAFTAPLE